MTNPNSTLPIVVTHESGKVIMTIHGRLDRDSVPSIGQSLGQIADTDDHQVIIDLHDVSFIDTAGLRLLITASEGFRRLQRDLILTDPTPPITRALATCEAPPELTVLALDGFAASTSSKTGHGWGRSAGEAGQSPFHPTTGPLQ
jgi:anti-anti-sigma factor